MLGCFVFFVVGWGGGFVVLGGGGGGGAGLFLIWRGGGLSFARLGVAGGSPGGSPRCVQYTKKKPVLSYELFFKYGGEGGIDSLRSPCGQPAHCVHGLSNWLSPVVDPRSGLLIPPRCVQYTKKKPVLSYELFFKYGGEGGIDSLRSPCGQPAHCVHGLSNWLSPVVDPRSGLLIPPGVCNIRKKSPYFRTSSSLNMAVRGGLTRFARPAGSPLTAFTVCPTGCRQLSTPGRGFSSPPGVCNIRKKSPYFRTSSSLNMAVRGGFEPPIRCRIHTFQACSFSHSDTSPNCRSCLAGTGANLGKS